jgi:hypothetical protein
MSSAASTTLSVCLLRCIVMITCDEKRASLRAVQRTRTTTCQSLANRFLLVTGNKCPHATWLAPLKIFLTADHPTRPSGPLRPDLAAHTWQYPVFTCSRIADDRFPAIRRLRHILQPFICRTLITTPSSHTITVA